MQDGNNVVYGSLFSIFQSKNGEEGCRRQGDEAKAVGTFAGFGQQWFLNSNASYSLPGWPEGTPEQQKNF
jgi:hypothetical protein